MSTPDLVFTIEIPTTVVITECATCDGANTVLEQLLDFLKLGQTTKTRVVTDGGNTIQSVNAWVTASATRKFTLKDAVDDTPFYELEQNSAVENCDGLLEKLGDAPRCDPVSVSVCILLEDSVHPTFSPSDVISVEGAETSAPFIDGELNRNVVCCPGEEIVCDPKDSVKSGTFINVGTNIDPTKFGRVQVSHPCEFDITVACTSLAQDPSTSTCCGKDPTCNLFTLVLAASVTDCPDIVSFMETDYKVIVSGPCFEIQNYCNVETKDPLAELEEIVDITVQKIKETALTGCCDSATVTVETSMERVCNRCCRGESTYEVTYTVTDECLLVTEKIQQIHFINPGWDKYFKSTCPCECEEPVVFV